MIESPALYETIEDEPATTTRRLVLQSTAAAGLAGCLDDGRTEAPDPPSQVETPEGTAVPGGNVLMTTDGERVYAIDNAKRVSGRRALDDAAVVADGEDTGRVLQAVFDSDLIGPHRESLGNGPIEPGSVPIGGHIHFGNGLFRWESQASTGGANAIRITGNYWGTDWSAEAEIESFVDFPDPPVVTGHEDGPQIGHLLVHGNDLADHVFTLGAYTDDTNVHDITCFQTAKSMIYAAADTTKQDFELKDTSIFRMLRVINGGPLAILEGGHSGIPAANRFEKCFCAYPQDTYGLVLRNAQRTYVDKFFVGLRTFQDTPGHGGVLIENPPNEDSGKDMPTKQSYLHMVEIEAPDNREAPAVHVRAPADATTENGTHKIVFPRGSHSYRFLQAEAAEPGGISEIELWGAQEPSSKSDAVELINTRDCRINLTTGVKDAREIVTIEGGERNTVNGVGRNPGDPNETGPWNQLAHEGLQVLDTEGDRLYEYVDGDWFAIGRR